MKTVYQLDSTDLNITYALRTGEKTVNHYRVPFSYYYVNHPDKKPIEELLKEAIGEEVEVKKYMKLPVNKTPNNTSLITEDIVFNKKTTKILSKIPNSGSTIYQRNFYKNKLHEIVARAYYYLRLRTYKNKLISILHKMIVSLLVQIFNKLDIINNSRQHLSQCLYLGSAHTGEKDIQEAIKNMEELIHSTKNLTLAKLNNPFIMPLSDTVFGDRFIVAVAWFVFLDVEKKDISEAMRIDDLQKTLKRVSRFNEEIPISNEKLNSLRKVSFLQEGVVMGLPYDNDVEITVVDLWEPPKSTY